MAPAAGLPGKKWVFSLWAGQIALAAVFGLAGFAKTTMPLAELAPKMPWTADVPAYLVRFIGVCELGGALGLLLPSLARILPKLTPLAALGLATIMTLAIPFHIMRGEARVIVMHFVMGGLAAFIAWGRLRKAPIASRS